MARLNFFIIIIAVAAVLMGFFSMHNVQHTAARPKSTGNVTLSSLPPSSQQVLVVEFDKAHTDNTKIVQEQYGGELRAVSRPASYHIYFETNPMMSSPPLSAVEGVRSVVTTPITTDGSIRSNEVERLPITSLLRAAPSGVSGPVNYVVVTLHRRVTDEEMANVIADIQAALAPLSPLFVAPETPSTLVIGLSDETRPMDVAARLNGRPLIGGVKRKTRVHLH